jgi:hypothetical protein
MFSSMLLVLVGKGGEGGCRINGAVHVGRNGRVATSALILCALPPCSVKVTALYSLFYAT